MIKAVVFDMDGVMFDTERLIMKAWAYTGEKLGYGDMSQVVYKTLGLPAPSAKRVFLNIYGEDFKYDEFVAEYRKFVYEYYEEFGVPIKDGLFELLRDLLTKLFLIFRLKIEPTQYFANSLLFQIKLHTVQEESIWQYKVTCPQPLATAN